VLPPDRHRDQGRGAEVVPADAIDQVMTSSGWQGRNLKADVAARLGGPGHPFGLEYCKRSEDGPAARALEAQT
jgi:hypothetical protein